MIVTTNRSFVQELHDKLQLGRDWLHWPDNFFWSDRVTGATVTGPTGSVERQDSEDSSS